MLLANGLAGRGEKVDMILLQKKGAFVQQLNPSIRVFDLNTRSAYTCLAKLVKVLRREKPDVLISALDLTSLMSLLARRMAGFPGQMIIQLHSMPSLVRRSAFKKRVERLLLSVFYPKAEHLVAVSQAVAVDFCRYTRIAVERVEVIYNPILLPELDHLRSQTVDQTWFQTGQLPVILAVGRLALEKNQQELLHAFKIVHNQRPTRLMILGEGQERQALENLAAELGLGEDFILPGASNNPYAYLSKAAAMVLPSLYEGLPTVLVEAMACGCPVIASNCPGGSAEILDGGKYGHLYPSGNVDALAQAILAVLDDDKRLPPAEWLDQFRLETAVQRYMDLLEKN